MLYDPKRDYVLTIPAVLAWLGRQPPDETYRYNSTDTCMAARYNRSIGRKYDGPSLWGLLFAPLFRPSRLPFNEVLEQIAWRGAHTFGAAAKRARLIVERDRWPSRHDRCGIT